MNPQRKGVLPDLIRKMVEHYHFLKFPVSFEDTNLDNGMVFLGGVWEDTAIEEVRIYFNGFIVATGESTDRTEAFFEEMMGWWQSELDLTFNLGMVTQKLYVSQIVVRSSVNLDQVNPAVAAVAAEFFNKPTGIGAIDFYHQGNPDATPIRFERVNQGQGIPIAWDEYWTQTPLPTSRHLEFVAAFEKALSG
jgi:hypothetical protein